MKVRNAFIGTGTCLLIELITSVWSQTCDQHNNCNSHGICDIETGTCSCFEGWGASTDISLKKAADYSMRTCPSGRAWNDVPIAANTAHLLAECSNRGKCDHTTGECACFTGFTGAACERSACINECSGHGRCISINKMVSEPNALPLIASGAEYTYGDHDSIQTWEANMVYGCVCDLSWKVGLGSGETQTTEWFGPDCSLRRCPGGDDISTPLVDETDCEGVSGADVYGGAVGLAGNLCHVDCSNRGTCNHITGQCKCYDGYYGENCGSLSAFAKSLRTE